MLISHSISFTRRKFFHAFHYFFLVIISLWKLVHSKVLFYLCDDMSKVNLLLVMSPWNISPCILHTLRIGIFWGKIYEEIIEICVRMNNSFEKCFYVAMQSPSWRVHTESPRGIFYSRNFINLIPDVVVAL